MDAFENFEKKYGVVNDDEFQAYLRYMRTDETWGDSLELLAASRVFECTIVVYSYDRDTQEIRLTTVGDTGEIIGLDYFRGNHYDVNCGK